MSAKCCNENGFLFLPLILITSFLIIICLLSVVLSAFNCSLTTTASFIHSISSKGQYHSHSQRKALYCDLNSQSSILKNSSILHLLILSCWSWKTSYILFNSAINCYPCQCQQSSQSLLMIVNKAKAENGFKVNKPKKIANFKKIWIKLWN